MFFNNSENEKRRKTMLQLSCVDSVHGLFLMNRIGYMHCNVSKKPKPLHRFTKGPDAYLKLNMLL